jgi:MFS family permease
LSTAANHDPYLALRFRDYRFLISGSFIAAMGNQMLALAIGYELYERTHSALDLGFVGLVQVMPVLLLSLPAGQVADQYNRKTIVFLSQFFLATMSVALTVVSYFQGSLLAIYGCLLLIGIGTAFNGPAARTLPTEIVPETAFESSATWSSSAMQIAFVVGPTLAGVLIALFNNATLVYALNAVAALIYVVLLLFVRGNAVGPRPVRKKEPRSLRTLGQGAAFLRRSPIILAAITLDLFAVLFGGATTLLPIFAKDILQVGPTGLGWLRAAPSLGAICMAMYLAHRPPLQRAGMTLLVAVTTFGVATVLFGLSHSFLLSMAMLFILGGMDNISVIVRNTLTLLRTPNEMRGRVAAINGLFISTSNQLGGFESGLTAQLFTPMWSVVGGGIGTILVVLVVAIAWPELRNLTTMRDNSVEAVTR